MNNCKKCNKETKNPKFCSRSCSASFNNLGKVKNGKRAGNCVVCNKKLGQSCRLSCSYSCHHKNIWNKKVKDYIEFGSLPAKSDWGIRRFLRKYLINEYGSRCQICSTTEWMNKPVPLVIDHIDGNPFNHNKNNIRLVCGNCDMLLPTYKNKNKGNGRAYRRKGNNKS